MRSYWGVLRTWVSLGMACVILGPATVLAQERHAARFTAHEIATGMVDGYQVLVADINADGRPDLLPVASGLSELAWFENPGWARHVITRDLTRPENADAFDLDGDGIPEIGLVSGFSQSPATSAGIVTILTHADDPRALWVAREIDRIPTSHRARWVDIDGSGRRVFVNAPMVGPQAERPDYRDQTPLVLYRPGAWQREVISTTEGVVHGLYVSRRAGEAHSLIITAGFAGVFVNELRDGAWQRTHLIPGSPEAWPRSGASEFTELWLGEERLFATIEPWHGHQAGIYYRAGGAWIRRVVDEDVSLGHAVVAADLDGDGRQELIVADRGDARGVYVYTADASGGVDWHKEILDDEIQASSCAAADVNEDALVDIVCIGRATEDLKWYEQRL
jgi:hypothetical protein